MDKKNKKIEDYIVVYQSQEHYEVLGFIRAKSIGEAEKKAKVELLDEAKHYDVEEAELSKLKDTQPISFNISQSNN